MNAAPQLFRPAGQANGTIAATAIPSGATVTSNAQGQLVDMSSNIILDNAGQPVTSMAALVAAQQQALAPAQMQPLMPGAVAMVQVPAYDASGNVLTDASGKPVMQTIPANSAQALALAGPLSWMPGGAMGALLALAALGAVAFGASYAGTRVAVKRERSPRRPREASGRSRRTRELPV